jgi:hypothetical protein
MGSYDQNNRKREQNQLIIVPILLREQEKHPPRKEQKWNGTPVMSCESMSEGQDANYKSQPDHTRFKPEVMDDIYAENGHTGQEQG